MKQNRFLCGLLTMMMVAMLSVGFTACSDDDDDKGSGSGIVGTWSGRDDDAYLTVTFKKDGTGTWVSKFYDSYDGTTETERGKLFYERKGGSNGYITVVAGDEIEPYYFEIEGQKIYLYYIDDYDDEIFLEWILTKE